MTDEEQQKVCIIEHEARTLLGRMDRMCVQLVIGEGIDAITVRREVPIAAAPADADGPDIESIDHDVAALVLCRAVVAAFCVGLMGGAAVTLLLQVSQ